MMISNLKLTLYTWTGGKISASCDTWMIRFQKFYTLTLWETGKKEQWLNYQFESEASEFFDCHSVAVVWICRSHSDLLHQTIICFHDYIVFPLQSRNNFNDDNFINIPGA